MQDLKSTYRSLLHFYQFRTNYQREKLRKRSHLQLQQNIKHIDKSKEVKDLNMENYSMLMKEKKT